MKHPLLPAATLVVMLPIASLQADTVNGLTTFSSGTPALAIEVNANFTAVKSAVDDNDARITVLEGAAPGGGSGPTGYGDGSSGALVISTSQDWTDAGGDAPANDSLQFTDFTINSGQTLTVPSGTVILCTGTFVNNGTLVVNPGYQRSLTTALLTDVAKNEPGANRTAPGNWNVPGIPHDRSTMRRLLNPGPIAGQQGGQGNLFNVGGDGGGSLVIRCAGGISNNGSISASGSDAEAVGDGANCIFTVGCTGLAGASDIDDDTRGGGGGGGGGLIILGSAGTIVTGSIDLSGGNGANGGNSTVSTSGGGGGGGGVLHLLGPAASTTSTASVNVSGGTRGLSTIASGALCSNEADTTCGITRSGGVGGSMGGRGGLGGSGSSGSNSGCFLALLETGDITLPLSGTDDPDNFNNSCNVGRNGAAGYVLATDVADPGPLFLQ